MTTKIASGENEGLQTPFSDFGGGIPPRGPKGLIPNKKFDCQRLINKRRVNFHPFGSGCRKRAATPYNAVQLPHPLRIIFPFLARNTAKFKWDIPHAILVVACRSFRSLGWFLQPPQLLQLLIPGKSTGIFVGDTLRAFHLIQGWKNRYHKSCYGHHRVYPDERLLDSSDKNRFCSGFTSVHNDLKSSGIYQGWHPFDAGSSDISSMMQAMSTSSSLRAMLEADGYYDR